MTDYRKGILGSAMFSDDPAYDPPKGLLDKKSEQSYRPGQITGWAEKQGCRIKKGTKHPWIIQGPNGGTVGLSNRKYSQGEVNTFCRRLGIETLGK